MKHPCRSCKYENEDKNQRHCVECPKRFAYAAQVAAGWDGVTVIRAGIDEESPPDAGLSIETVITGRQPVDLEPKKEVPEMTETETKICSRPVCRHAGAPQPVDNFYIDRNSKDGRCYYCKDCQRELSKINTLKKKKAPAAETETKKPDAGSAADPAPAGKICSRCGMAWEDPAEGFHRSVSVADGYQNICKQCFSAASAKGRMAGMAKIEQARKAAVDIPEGVFLIDLAPYPQLRKDIDELARNQVRTPEQQIVFVLMDYVRGYGIAPSPFADIVTRQDAGQ